MYNFIHISKKFEFTLLSNSNVAHTQDVVKDGRVSLTVTANDFKGAAGENNSFIPII